MLTSKKSKSFGLLEVMFVVAIFLLVIATVISVVGLGYKNLAKNEARWKATLLAQNFLEQRAVVRDNVVLDWLALTNPEPTQKISDPAWKTLYGYSVQASPCPYTLYYDYNMNPTVSSNAFFTLNYTCPDAGHGNVIHEVTVVWNQFNRQYEIHNDQFLKNVSGAVH